MLSASLLTSIWPRLATAAGGSRVACHYGGVSHAGYYLSKRHREFGRKPSAKLVQKLTEAIDEAYHIGDTLIFLREYPAEDVAMDGRLQSENPKILEALKRISEGT